MYRNAYQRGMLTIFFSVGSKPLNCWETHTQDGYISRFLDQDIKSMVLEIGGTNVSTTYMTCPKGKAVLGIAMPFLVMIVKNLKKYFSFEVTILDETGTRRRFRVSNFQSTTQIMPLCTVMPIDLSEGWNQIQFNLAEFTRRAYKKQFVEVQKLKINANIRLRRIYFTERLIPEDQLPPEYKLFFPLASKGTRVKQTGSQKEMVAPSTSQQIVIKEGEKKSVLEVTKESSMLSVKRTSVSEPKKSEVNMEATGEAPAPIPDAAVPLAEDVEHPVQPKLSEIQEKPVDEETPAEEAALEVVDEAKVSQNVLKELSAEKVASQIVETNETDIAPENVLKESTEEQVEPQVIETVEETTASKDALELPPSADDAAN